MSNLLPKTVFVIGAGASKEVDLPTGYELKSRISELLDIRFDSHVPVGTGDAIILKALTDYIDQTDLESDLNSYLHEAWKIRDALPYAISIDNFIDAHREDNKIELCGKLAIVRSILEAERTSSLFFEQSNITERSKLLARSWYLPFFQILTENCTKKDLEERFKSIALIIFNYDRCVEHFLYHALQLYYHMTEDEAADLVKSIEIYHPYGKVADLPWIGGSFPMKFGQQPQALHLLKLVPGIKTFTEGTDPGSSEIFNIRIQINELSKLVFIGFGFHKLNMELLKPQTNKTTKTAGIQCFTTTYGISASDKEVVQREINALYGSKIDTRMADLTCHDFFSEFWRSLSFE